MEYRFETPARPNLIECLSPAEKKPEVEKKPDNPEYLSVKVLENLPTFTGMDAKNYTLKNGDIESIPIYNARILSDAGKVKLVKEVKVWLTKELIQTSL